MVDGILNVNKPLGKTSFDIVALVRSLSGERQVGHGGTLDPQATGVLPVCLGQGTRVAEYFMVARKTYLSEIELGKETDTYDSEGKVVRVSDTSGVNKAQVLEALAKLQGEIEQTPPMYSAIKHEGKALYKLAREGKQVDLKPRKVRIYRIDVSKWQPPVVTVEVECGRGTYIRSIAHDLGVSLGCGGYVKSLARVKLGPLDVCDALTVEQLGMVFEKGGWRELLYPLDIALTDLSAGVFDASNERAIVRGRALDLGATSSEGSMCRAYACDGRFVGLLSYQGPEGWHPTKVFDTSLGVQSAAKR